MNRQPEHSPADDQRASPNGNGRLERLNALLSLTAALSEALTPTDVAEIIVSRGVATLGASAGSVSLLNAELDALEVVASIGYPSEMVYSWRRFPLDAGVPLADAVRSATPIFIDGHDDILHRYPDLASRLQRGSGVLAAIPLIADGAPIGAIGLNFPNDHIILEEEREFMMALARQCTMALERSRLYEAEMRERLRAEEAEKRLWFLVRAGERLAASLDTETTLNSITEIVVPEQADGCAIYLRRSDGSISWNAIAHHDPRREQLMLTISERYPIKHGAARGVASVIESGTGINVPRLTPQMLSEYAVDDGHRDLLLELAPTSMIIVPLEGRGEVIGAMVLTNQEERRSFSPEDFTMAVDLSRRAALAIDSAMRFSARIESEEKLRLSEERFRALVDTAPDVIYSLSAHDATITALNPAFEVLTGWRREEWIGRQFHPLVHPDDLEPAVELFLAVLAGETPPPYELRILTIDGDYRIGEFRSRPRFEDGVVVESLGIARDVTGRKETERELIAAKNIAEAASRAKDQFLATLSHELRTPLTPVLAAVQAIEEGCSGEEMAPLLEIIHRNIELEAHLIDDMLDLTRIARGKIQLDFRAIDPHRLIGHVMEICSGAIEAKNLKISLDLAAGDVIVMADPSRLQQVFWNLVQNAVKFTPDGGTISIRSSLENRRWRLVIRDSGIGIPPDVLPHIFNAFEQGDATITRQFGGLGLGLAISKALIDAHNGSLVAESEGIGKGASFIVELGTGSW
jgi:PAS domain S-box-containing protein